MRGRPAGNAPVGVRHAFELADQAEALPARGRPVQTIGARHGARVQPLRRRSGDLGLFRATWLVLRLATSRNAHGALADSEDADGP